MTLEELYQHLGQVRASGVLPDTEVMVLCESSEACVGASPAVRVTSARMGLDWDTGKLFLQPEPRLSASADEGTVLRRQCAAQARQLASARCALAKGVSPEVRVAMLETVLGAAEKFRRSM